MAIWAAWLACGIVAFALWLLLAGLGTSSFWQDEIFSMSLAKQPGFNAMLSVALTDTHPPLYYSLLYAWTALFGHGEIASRAMSAMFSAGIVAALLLLPRSGIGWPARTAAAVLAVTAPFWTEHASELRSYALVALALTGAALASSRLVAGEARRKRWAALFVGCAFVASATHLFGIYSAGWLSLSLAAASPAQWRVAAAGLAASLAAAGLYAAQLLTFPVVGASSWMFDQSAWDLLVQAKIGLRTAGLAGLLLMVLIAGLAALPSVWRDRSEHVPAAASQRHDLLLAAAPLAVTVAGLLVTAVIPSMNYRGAQVPIAIFWCGAAGIIDAALRAWPRAAGAGLLGAVAGTAAWLASWQTLAPLPMRAEFRSLSQYIAADPACHGKVIPVLRDSWPRPGRAVPPDATAALIRILNERHGFYDEAARHRYVPFLLRSGRYRAQDAPRQILQERSRGADRCPVLAVVAEIDSLAPETIEARLREAVADSGGDPALVRVRWFTHYALGRPAAPVRAVGAFTIARQSPGRAYSPSSP